MAIGVLGGTLRHLRDLFHDGSSVGLGDGQLLARYVADRDEAAFEALVARHGPMVLATCRAVLKDEHDVEDAFQATFLVLARTARSVRAGEALGGWLHRIAYRAAVHAQRDAQRRRRREAEAMAMATLKATHTAPDPDSEIASIVHEELDRLPDGQRLPVMLCDLEGLTYEQAAGRLRWTEPTLRHRLVKARCRLRERLTRRGVTVGSVGAVSAAGARAAVPAGLARSAVAAAMGGTSTATAAALTAAIIRSLTMAKLKFAAPGVLAAIAVVSAGAMAVGSWRPDPPTAVLHSQAGAAMERPSAAKDRPTPSPAPSPGELIEVRGRVVDPQGRTVAGAAVRTAYLDRDDEPAPETTSGPDGRFTMRVPPQRRNSARRRADALFPWVVASAPGFGPGWASAVREPGADETTIRLVEDGPPIEGRIVDLEGRPVAGARVKVEHIWLARKGDLSAWLDRVRSGNIRGPWQGLDQLPAAVEATVGSDGRFRLTGIGRDRLAELLLSAPTIATTQLYVANHDGTPIRAADPDSAMMSASSWTTYYTRRFEYAAAPTRPIEGVVRDKDTGRPIAGLHLRGMVFEEHSLVPAPGIEATTDIQGRYRLTGLPKAPAYRLFIEPGKGQPYTKATFQTPAGSPALEPITFDMKLKRGVLVRGRVTDKATGRPVSGYVNSYTFTDNPHVGEFPGYRSSYNSYARIGDDGRYEVVTLPGRGLIACRSDLGRYLGGVGASAIKGFNPKLGGVGGFDTLPGGCLIADYHVLAEVKPDPEAAVTTLDLQVDPGRSLTIHVVDPEGQPLGGTKASGLTDLFWSIAYQQDSPTIEVHALDPSKPRRVTITHEGRKLVGSVHLKGDEAGPLTIRLQPWGVVTGRIIDEDGQPRGGLALINLIGIYPKPPADQGILPGDNASPGILVGRDGRFRVEGFVPGLHYGASAVQGSMYVGEVFRDVPVAPGEVKDLGDLKVVPLKRGN
jgi:RNA polymerase sigma factor (sigma-70 family)